ncbi:MAG: hypothetical protein AAGC69_13940 [Paracraurococcus sp.]
MVARLLRCRRGAAALEFAAAGSAFVVLLLVLIETCWQVAVGAALDAGAREASRWVATGQAPPSGYTANSYMTEVILKGSGLPLDGAALSVAAQSFGSFGALAAAGKPGLGGAGDVVEYTVTYHSAGLTPIGRALLPLGLLRIQFAVLVKNEPYPK